MTERTPEEYGALLQAVARAYPEHLCVGHTTVYIWPDEPALERSCVRLTQQQPLDDDYDHVQVLCEPTEAVNAACAHGQSHDSYALAVLGVRTAGQTDQCDIVTQCVMRPHALEL